MSSQNPIRSADKVGRGRDCHVMKTHNGNQDVSSANLLGAEFRPYMHTEQECRDLVRACLPGAAQQSQAYSLSALRSTLVHRKISKVKQAASKQPKPHLCSPASCSRACSANLSFRQATGSGDDCCTATIGPFYARVGGSRGGIGALWVDGLLRLLQRRCSQGGHPLWLHKSFLRQLC